MSAGLNGGLLYLETEVRGSAKEEVFVPVYELCYG
jgi:hypothetical protein